MFTIDGEERDTCGKPDCVMSAWERTDASAPSLGSSVARRTSFATASSIAGGLAIDMPTGTRSPSPASRTRAPGSCSPTTARRRPSMPTAREIFRRRWRYATGTRAPAPTMANPLPPKSQTAGARGRETATLTCHSLCPPAAACAELYGPQRAPHPNGSAPPRRDAPHQHGAPARGQGVPRDGRERRGDENRACQDCRASIGYRSSPLAHARQTRRASAGRDPASCRTMWSSLRRTVAAVASPSSTAACRATRGWERLARQDEACEIELSRDGKCVGFVPGVERCEEPGHQPRLPAKAVHLALHGRSRAPGEGCAPTARRERRRSSSKRGCEGAVGRVPPRQSGLPAQPRGRKAPCRKSAIEEFIATDDNISVSGGFVCDDAPRAGPLSSSSSPKETTLSIDDDSDYESLARVCARRCATLPARRGSSGPAFRSQISATFPTNWWGRDLTRSPTRRQG